MADSLYIKLAGLDLVRAQNLKDSPGLFNFNETNVLGIGPFYGV